mgnify:CR=1 FL=1
MLINPDNISMVPATAANIAYYLDISFVPHGNM